MQEVEKARLQLASKAAPVSAGLHLDHHEQEHFLKGLHHHRDQQEHLLGRPKGFESHSGCPQECRRLRKGSVPWPESVVLAERNELGLLGIASLITHLLGQPTNLKSDRTTCQQPYNQLDEVLTDTWVPQDVVDAGSAKPGSPRKDSVKALS